MRSSLAVQICCGVGAHPSPGVWEALAGLDDLRDYAAAVNRAISS